jgi:branched-chain amino acid transport system substrate-binding protein
MRTWTIPLLFLIWTPLTQAKTVKVSVLTEVPEVVKDLDVFKSIPATAQIALESRKKQLQAAGIEVVFDYHQNKMDPSELHDTMKKVYDSDAIAAVGYRSSAGVEYASKIIQGTDFVAVSPFATAAKAFDLKPNYYAVVAGNKEIAKHLEDFIRKDLKSKRPLSIVAWDSPYSRDFHESFSTGFLKQVKLLKTWESLDGFEKELDGIRKYNPDVIILPNFPMASASLIRILTNAGIKPVFVGADSWGEGEQSVMPKILKQYDYRAYTIRQFSIFQLTEKQLNFKKTLKEKYGSEYASVTGLYHDSILLILDLILKSKNNLTRKGILEAAKKVKNIEGVMGKNCLSSHVCPGRSFTILGLNPKGYQVHRVIQR